MESLLFLWAKENPEFKYQQGMNEILGIIIIALGSELYFKEENEDSEGEEEEYLSHQ